MHRASRIRLWSWLVIFAPLGVAAGAACVGTDAPLAGSGVDASTDGGGPGPSEGGSEAGGGTDAGDAGACDLAAPFEAPAPVAGLDALGSAARFSADEKTAFFAIAVGDAGLDQLYQASRGTLADPFGTPAALTALNDAMGETTPFVSADGKTLFYSRDLGGADGRDIWYGTRSDTLATFGNPQMVGVINDPTQQDDYVSQASNGDLWFSSRRNQTGVNQIFHAPFVGGGFGTPVVEDEIDSATESNLYPLLTPDLLRIYFQRGMSATIWTATRSTPSGPFSNPQAVAELNTSGVIERPAWVSTDGCRLYLAQGTPVQMLVASRPAPP